jgi:hypothetical protein
MEKIFKCHPLSSIELGLTSNRLTAVAKLMTGHGYSNKHAFILDTGATISTMSKSTATDFFLYDKDVMNPNAIVGGFNKQPMSGRIIRVSRLHIGIMGVKDTLFFVPDSYDEIAEVLGANVLNGLVPIPDFEAKRIWIMKNNIVPPPFYSNNLGVEIGCEVLAQEAM